MRRLSPIFCLVACLSGTSPAFSADTRSLVDFNRQIRPILSAKCFACHGPDEEGRQAGLRLDLPKAGEESGAIVPGSAEGSELYARITSEDPDLIMPPASSHKSLKPEEIELLRQWLEEGASYEALWSFVPPRRSAVPREASDSWSKNAIDHFVRERMQAAGLSPSPPADLEILARRVSLDLIGLTPLPDEVDEFLADAKTTNTDDAYERLVDRLLSSPRYGERWAQQWLDLARYADSNGYEKDQPRNIWPFRDWVVRALNEDMPFDEFTIQQIAGDMLPEATITTRTATGFHRNTMLNEEGGIDPLEFRFYAMTDRVATTGTTWLGLTLGCAQCHTHKYDPISHHEYYELMAFLNNADEPSLDLPDPEADRQHQENLDRAARLLEVLPTKWTDEESETSGAARSVEEKLEIVRTSFRQWLETERQQAVAWEPLRPLNATSNLPLLTIMEDDSIIGSGDTTKRDTYNITYELPNEAITAIRLEVLPHDSLPGHGPGMTYYEGTKGDFFMGEFELAADGVPVKFEDVSDSYAANQYKFDVSAKLLVDGDPQTGWSVYGASGKRNEAVFTFKQPVEATGKLQVTMQFGRHYASSLGRFRLSYTACTGPHSARGMPRPIEEALSASSHDLSANQEQQLWEYFLLTAAELDDYAEEIRKLREPTTKPNTLVMRERPEHNPRPTHVHHRGEFLQPREEVKPGVPTALHSFQNSLPRNRLGFALWLMSADNPLTPRVVVNRHWATLFGQGIVTTLDDFGVLGAQPSHPELLDWLAVEFIDSGWSQKHLHKLMVMSATYRQSSRFSDSLLEKDPENQWLARSSRQRLPAEMVRDSILRASGLLSLKMGGPGVKPPQPDGVTEVAFGNPKWQVSEGEDRYRRSIYTFKKRTAPFAMYEVFDAPSGEFCTAERQISNTPMQSLTLLNDIMFAEAARALGRLLADHPGNDLQKASTGFRRVVARSPSEQEQLDLLAFVNEQRNRVDAGELNATVVAGTDAPDAGEGAAWTCFARVLFGLDESISRN